MDAIERTDHDEGIVRISFDLPETHNAQTPEMLDELTALLGAIEDEEESRVVILDGNGPSFSSGHDMGRSRTRTWTAEERLAFEEEYYFEHSMTLRNFELPTIAQVHGYCGAAGLMLLSMCDLAMATEEASFANPVHRMAGAGVELLVEPWEMGFKKAKEFLWTGDSVSGSEAERLGIVNHAVPEEELHERTMRLATKVARMPPFAVKLSKESFNFLKDEMGQRASFRHHFMVHQLSHLSEEWRDWHAEARDVFEEDGLPGFIEHRDSAFDLDDE